MQTTSRPMMAHGTGDTLEDEDGLFGIDIGHIISVVRRNLLWIALIIGAALAAGLILTMLAVPRYQATAKVLVETEADQIIEGSNLQPTTNAWDIDRFLQTQVDILESRALAERIVEAEGLAKDSDFFAAFGVNLPDQADLPAEFSGPDGYEAYKAKIAAGLLQGGLSASLPANSRIISIGFQSNDPVYSAKLANAYAENFIEANLSRKFDSSSYARNFLSQQLDEARARLEKSERELNQYSRVAGLIRVSGQGANANQETTLSVTNDSLLQINQAASQASADRVAAEDRWKTIANEPVLSIPQVLANSAVQDLIRQKAVVEGKLAEERARHLDGHPSVQALRAQVREFDSRIQTVGGAIKRSVFLEFQAAKEKEESLTGRVSGLRSAALEEQDRGVEYNLLKRVAETNRALYDTLLERYNQLSATAGAAANNMSLVDRAQVPSGPSSPNLMLNLLLALFSGAVVAALFVFLRDYFDDAIRSPEDVEARLGVPMLGLIPIADDADAALADSKTAVSEGYHSLVTNLMYSSSAGLPRSLLVTSASEAEGKTTSAYALALDLARLDRKVLLIDADLRRPTLHRRLDAPAKYGLTDLLTGQAHFEETLVHSGVANLSYIVGLPIPPDPSILLGGERLPRIMAAAQERFDVVIVDSPPMLGLSDAASIATQVEGVMLVIDATDFRRGAVKSALRRLGLVKAPVLGAVVTKFDPKTADGEYSYYGYNYYQYGDRKAEPA